MKMKKHGCGTLGCRKPKIEYNHYFLNGLKARSSKVFEIRCKLVTPERSKSDTFARFYDHYNGPLDSTIEYKQFDTSDKNHFELLHFENVE